MDLSPGTKLNNNQTPLNYKSFGGSFGTKDLTKDFTIHLQTEQDPDTDFSHLPNEIPLKQLVSGDCDLTDKGFSLKNTGGDPPSAAPKTLSSWHDTLVPLYAASIIFAIAVTVAMFLHIYLGKFQIRKGVLVTDDKYCTALGQRVLHDQGSSVDAAIVAVLCLGVVHPHLSGIGGGGVMLVHDIYKKESRAINFQESAPYAIKELFHNALELKPGLQVGVPSMLKGLHKAHELYGSLSWKDVVTRAADVARDGFNVSHSLAEAINKVNSENLSGRFRSTFFPGGRALVPGTFLRMRRLAAVLETGLSDFYSGNISQEMVDEVQANGGVLSREDISNYSAEFVQPVEGLYHEFKVLVPPPPSVGAALISTLNILEGFNLHETGGSPNTYHWIAESLKAALALASGLDDPLHNSSINELLSEMLSIWNNGCACTTLFIWISASYAGLNFLSTIKSRADMLRQKINSSHASPPEHDPTISIKGEPVASQVMVTGPDGLIVSVTSSLSRPFGSRIMTPSGILLNSHILDFSMPNKTKEIVNTLRNRIQPGKRPLSSLMTTIVVPPGRKCGSYLALSNSDGEHSLSGITQVLINALSRHKEMNDSLSIGRLHPQLQSNSILVDSQFPEEAVQMLRGKGHIVQRVKALSVVQGIQWNKDFIGPR